MNILMLAHWLPGPRRAEEARREYHFARRLLKDHWLTLAFTADDRQAKGSISALRAEFGDIEFAVLPRAGRTLSAAVRGAIGRSSSVAYFRSDALRVRLARRLKASPYDLVYVSSSSMMPYAIELDPGIPLVADFGEVDSEWWAQQGAARAFPAANFYRIEASRLREVEASAALRAAHCIVASPRAARVLAGRTHDSAITVVPDGVDQQYFSSPPRTPSTRTVAIVGRLDGATSVEALARFCLTTVPGVRSVLPDVRFHVATRNTPPSARRLAEIAGLETMTSRDDIRPLLHSAALAVAPLPPEGSLPAGIVEAMLMGVPVVAVPGAVKGLGAVTGRDLLVEDNPSAFAQEVIHLLGEPDRNAALAARGQAFARAHCSWEAATASLVRLIETAVSAPKRTQAVTLWPALEEQPLAVNGRATTAAPL